MAETIDNTYYPGDWVRPRDNNGEWKPIFDPMEVYCGHRGTTRKGDFEVFDDPTGVKITIEEASKSEPILEVDKVPWETRDVHPLWTWQGDGDYGMLYFHSFNNSQSKNNVGYAVSEDGYDWTRPDLGMVEHNGSTSNNLIPTNPHGPLFFEDPTAPAEERFKSITNYGGGLVNGETGESLGQNGPQYWKAQEYEGYAYDGPRVELSGKATGWTSPDRINWKRIEKPLLDAPIDGGIAGGYDPETKSYFAYVRLHGLPSPELQGIGGIGPEKGIVRRAIGFTRTKDFYNWPPPKLVLHPDGQDDLDISFYGSSYFRYPGQKSLHCLLIQVYHHISDTVDCQIAFSRDGIYWHRPERRSIIPLGATGSAEDARVYSWGSGLVELPNGDWGYAYSGRAWLHNERRDTCEVLARPSAKIRWARWNPHRLCGIEATTYGEFTIPTIHRVGKHLSLNYRCNLGGWVSVELLRRIPSAAHLDVDPIEGFTFDQSDRLTGDCVDKTVTWNGNADISGIGDTVAIRIRLFGAKVFAYKV